MNNLEIYLEFLKELEEKREKFNMKIKFVLVGIGELGTQLSIWKKQKPGRIETIWIMILLKESVETICHIIEVSSYYLCKNLD